MAYYQTYHWFREEVAQGDINLLRARYRSLCLEHHPDKGGEHAVFVQIVAEYENACSALAEDEFRASANRRYPDGNPDKRGPRYTAAGESAIREMLDRLMGVPGIHIELCGSWVWVSGNTYPVHARLKHYGMKYSKGKKKWWWTPYETAKGKYRGRYSMKQIRSRYGSIDLGNTGDEETRKQLSAEAA